MKKITALLLVLVFAFTLVACGNESGKTTNNNSSKAAESSAAAESSVAESSVAEASTAISTVEDYIAIVKADTDTWDAMVAQVESMGMKFDVKADGNNMVYVYTYTVEVAENAKEILEDSFVTNNAQFVSNAEAIRAEAPCVEKVIWEYYTMDGELITSLEK